MRFSALHFSALIAKYHACLKTFDYDHYPSDFAAFEEDAKSLFSLLEDVSKAASFADAQSSAEKAPSADKRLSVEEALSADKRLSAKEAPSEAARALLDNLTAGYASLPSKKSLKEACFRDKQVLALFFTPVALKKGGVSEAIAKELCTLWNARFPKEPYYPGTYETILKGFDANLLGLPLRKSKRRR